MSPAEEVIENFSMSTSASTKRGDYNHIPKTAQPDAQRPPSPPISPQSTDATPIDGSTDPPLFPEGASDTPSQPLFQSTRSSTPEARQVVEEHIRANRIANPAGNYPTTDDYMLVVTFREDMYRHYAKDPRSWLIRERAQLVEDDRARKAHLKTIKPKPLAPRSGTNSTTRPDPIRSATAPRHSDKVAKKKASKPRPARTESTKPRPESSSASVSQNAPNREATAKPTTKSKNRDFRSIPDYSPPLQTLDDPAMMRGRTLEVLEAKEPLDLSHDPLKGLLHPAELRLAAHMKLNCATYLYCKRRIFYKRLEFYHQGKDFKKTHAQGVCNIDVNKASRLHVAFEGVGWLRPEWMSNFPPVEPLAD